VKVIRERLDGIQIQRLIVIDPEGSNHFRGECVGYLCPECMQADETLEQIWHDEDCSLAGKHGRAHYDDLEPDVPGRPVPEFDPAHPITVVKFGKTEGRGGLHDGEVLGFYCNGCGNADETMFEIVHDEVCDLANRCRHAPTSRR